MTTQLPPLRHVILAWNDVSWSGEHGKTSGARQVEKQKLIYVDDKEFKRGIGSPFVVDDESISTDIRNMKWYDNGSQQAKIKGRFL